MKIQWNGDFDKIWGGLVGAICAYGICGTYGLIAVMAVIGLYYITGFFLPPQSENSEDVED